MARFMAALKARWPEWHAMIFTQFVTASRFSEVSALRWEDIDWERGRIRIRRGNWRTIVSTAKIDRQRRTVALIDELRTELVAWRQWLIERRQRHLASGWVFPSHVGKPHHNSSVLPEGVRGLPQGRRTRPAVHVTRTAADGERFSFAGSPAGRWPARSRVTSRRG